MAFNQEITSAREGRIAVLEEQLELYQASLKRFGQSANRVERKHEAEIAALEEQLRLSQVSLKKSGQYANGIKREHAAEVAALKEQLRLSEMARIAAEDCQARNGQGVALLQIRCNAADEEIAEMKKANELSTHFHNSRAIVLNTRRRGLEARIAELEARIAAR